MLFQSCRDVLKVSPWTRFWLVYTTSAATTMWSWWHWSISCHSSYLSTLRLVSLALAASQRQGCPDIFQDGLIGGNPPKTGDGLKVSLVHCFRDHLCTTLAYFLSYACCFAPICFLARGHSQLCEVECLLACHWPICLCV